MAMTLLRIPGASGILFFLLTSGLWISPKSHWNCVRRCPVSVYRSILLRLYVECQTPFQKIQAKRDSDIADQTTSD